MFGTPGLIDMPSAATYDDADLKLTFGGFSGQSRNSLTFQVTPRITGTFRYSRLRGLDESIDDTLYDRSFDISYQILTETDNRPALAVGLRDFIGTGVYSSEYIVASKSLAPGFRVTGGLGWGRLGSYNGFGGFGERPALDFGLGGTLTSDQWFRGDIAPFGGVEWAVNDRVTLVAEYSSDAYEREDRLGEFDPKSPLNFGLSYQFDNGTVLSGYYLYGTQIGASVSFAFNPRTNNAPTGQETAPLPVDPRPSRISDPEAWRTDWVSDGETEPTLQPAIASVLAKDGILLEAMSLDVSVARVAIRNTRFSAQPQAIGRTARVLSRALPASVERFEITLVPIENVPASTVVLRRSDIEALEFASADALLARADIRDPKTLRQPTSIPQSQDLAWALEPYITASLFDPDAPVRTELGLRLRGQYAFGNGFVASGSIKKEIAGNLDTSDEPSTSELPPVRTNAPLYNAEGDPALEHLTIAHFGRPGEALYSRVTAGYLERMFGGISGELLWKPVDSRIAVGVEANWVKQRDFDQRLGFQDYDVMTGHVSGYYELPNGFLAQLDVGRYLAGDVGATATLSRTFNNGWSVGAYVTRTDASFEEFGEGSFDKGVRLTIPTDWFLGTASRQTRNINLRSLARDGGARLEVKGRLYDQVRDTHSAGLENQWERFWR